MAGIEPCDELSKLQVEQRIAREHLRLAPGDFLLTLWLSDLMAEEVLLLAERAASGT